jgi:toxin ParE1/3/4
MKRVTWAEAADKDLTEIKAYLVETHGIAIAEKTIAALIRAARWLLDYPGAGSLLGIGKRRKWRPRGTRHVLIYKPVADGVHVVRVRHERNDWRPAPRD